MPKLIIAGVLFAVGLLAVLSQMFRAEPSGWVLAAGAVMAIFGAIGFSDNSEGSR